MDCPLVSIITPCYNAEKHIGQYLDSVLAQSYPRLELVLVDDGSTDKTTQIIESYRKKLEDRCIGFAYIHQEHTNQAEALNKGLAVFRGEYLIWPDADDILEPSSVETRVSFLESNEEYGFVRSDFYYVDDLTNTRDDETGFKNNNEPYLFEKLMTGETYCMCGCYMVRTESFFKVCPDRRIESSPMGQNFQMLLPVAYFFRCGYIDEKLYGVVLHDDSHSRSFRTPGQILERLADFERLIDEIYACCGITDRKLIRAKKRRNAAARCGYAVQFGDRRMLFEQHLVMLLNSDVNRRLFAQVGRYALSRSKSLIKGSLLINPGIYGAYDRNTRVRTDDRVIYLTFDSGWVDEFIPDILDALKPYSAHTAFFIVGSVIERMDRALLVRMKEEGHLICNHSLTHPDFTMISTSQIKAEINGCSKALYDRTGFAMDPYMRPPSGSYNRKVLKVAKRLGLKTILWSMAYFDWDANKQPGKRFVLDYFRRNHKNGAIVLMHTVSRSSAEALPEVLGYLTKEGYRFGSLSEFVK